MFKKTLVALAVLSCCMTSFANEMISINNGSTQCPLTIHNNTSGHVYTLSSGSNSSYTRGQLTGTTWLALQGNSCDGSVIVTNAIPGSTALLQAVGNKETYSIPGPKGSTTIPANDFVGGLATLTLN